jgi:hypothetical protein
MDKFFVPKFRVIQRASTKLLGMVVVVVQETHKASICFMLESNQVTCHFERKTAKLTDVLHYFMSK